MEFHANLSRTVLPSPAAFDELIAESALMPSSRANRKAKPEDEEYE